MVTRRTLLAAALACPAICTVAGSAGRRLPPEARGVWESGVTLAYGPRSLVVGHHAEAALLRDLASRADTAALTVSTVLRRAVRPVVLVPRTTAEAVALAGTGSVDGLAALASAGRVIVLPDAFARLTPVGRDVVLAHELTHVAAAAGDAARAPELTPLAAGDAPRVVAEAGDAVRAPEPARISAGAGDAVRAPELTRVAGGVGGRPVWLREGLADYVGYLRSGLPTRVAAAELAAEARAGRLPAALPADADFAPGAPRLAQVYQEAWLASRLIAIRYGTQALVDLYYRAAGKDLGQALASLGLSVPTLTAHWREYVRNELTDMGESG
ncbi:hypothetical protein ACFXJ8_03995 [Nonomuraea sp. NPDC059194]|uniref:hypothetical protein n=1 Tax=Nonomuraea sp. NPDC059194 TaxID=3346764 RepID=UPI003674F9EC